MDSLLDPPKEDTHAKCCVDYLFHFFPSSVNRLCYYNKNLLYADNCLNKKPTTNGIDITISFSMVEFFFFFCHIHPDTAESSD